MTTAQHKLSSKHAPAYPKFRVKLTTLGYTFIATTVGVGIASLNTGNNLLYLTFSMMLSFIVLSGVLSNTTLYKIRLSFKNQPRFFAKEIAHVPLFLLNAKKRFSSYAVNLAPIAKKEMKEHVHSAQKSFVLKILPLQKVACNATFAFEKRGLCQFPNFQLETYFPFGLLKKYIQIENEHSILVLPQRLDLEQSLYFNNNFMGDLIQQKKNISGNPAGLREYVQGDHYKNIHWKSSAKTLSLRVKEFESEESKDIGIQLILAENQNNETLEKALSFACTLLLQLDQQKIPCFLKINAQEKIRSHHGTEAMLKTLALYDHAKQNIKPSSLSDLQNKQTSLIISNLKSENLSQFSGITLIGAQQLAGLS